jgi:hypothetical protein
MHSVKPHHGRVRRGILTWHPGGDNLTAVVEGMNERGMVSTVHVYGSITLYTWNLERDLISGGPTRLLTCKRERTFIRLADTNKRLPSQVTTSRTDQPFCFLVLCPCVGSPVRVAGMCVSHEYILGRSDDPR